MNIEKTKIIKMIVILILLLLAVKVVSQITRKNSLTLTEYAALHKKTDTLETADNPFASLETSQTQEVPNTESASTQSSVISSEAETLQNNSSLTGFLLNQDSQIENRIVYADSFYYEPLSFNLQRYITGISYPQIQEQEENLSISLDDLRYLHILHYNFDGNITEGELICNQAIAQDLAEIFYELYQNEYQLEKVLLIDEYGGDDIASMEDNNTSCFNYRVIEGSSSLSKHALGLAVDINPLYNPYITYTKDQTENISPVSAKAYADRTVNFPYKIDENDLCYKLFKEHGFTWGGNWNSCKDYQHFQKTIK